MKRTLSITTKKNSYIINKLKGIILFVHPLVYFYFENKIDASLDNIGIKNVMKLYNTEKLKYKDEDIIYYYNKYIHFIRVGLIDYEQYPMDNYRQRLSSQLINFNISNVRQLVFEVTDKCNLSCKYCGYGEFYNYYDERIGSNMSINMAKKILEYFVKIWKSTEFSSYKNFIYISFYGGEPLMNMKLIKEVISFIKQQSISHISFVFSMTTNGVLLNRHMAYLVENNFKLLISLDGNESNNYYRKTLNGNNSFQLVYKNVCALRTRYPEYFSKNVRFNSVLHNKNSVSEIVSFFNQEFNKTPRIGELTTMGIDESKKDEFFKLYLNYVESAEGAEDYSIIEKKMFIALPNIKEIGRFIHLNLSHIYPSFHSFFKEKSSEKYLPTGTCSPFSRKIFITTKGNILPCENIPHKYSMGKISNVVEINIEDLVQKTNKRYDYVDKFCLECYNFSECQQCMYLIDDLDRSPICKGFLNEKGYLAKTSRLLGEFERKPGHYNRIINELSII